MKKNIFAIALVAIALCFGSCAKEIISGNEENPVNPVNTAKVQQTSDLINTDWTAVFSLGDFLYAMTGMNLSDYGCQFPEGFDSTMIYHINFDQNFAHITFSDNITIVNVAEVAGEYTMEEIEQMDLAYVYDMATHTGTLTAVGTDENGNPIDYQLIFTYDDNTDTFTINLQFANAEDENTTINFPVVFHRDAVNA
jgi:hypothetical protein